MTYDGARGRPRVRGLLAGAAVLLGAGAAACSGAESSGLASGEGDAGRRSGSVAGPSSGTGARPSPQGSAALRDGSVFPRVPTTHLGADYRLKSFSPTQHKPQSKLWHADGSWWALMISPAAKRIHVFELMADRSWRDTGAVVDDRETSHGDALFVRGALYTVSTTSSTEVRVNKLTYDRSQRRYLSVPGFPVVLSGRGADAPTIARDSKSRLWVAYRQGRGIWVTHSLADSERTWTKPYSPHPVLARVSADDVAAVVAFRGRIGLMWSNQRAGAFRFAVHDDGSSDERWAIETPVQGAGLADDHINLKASGSDGEGRVFAAVKTSLGDVGEPATSPGILVLVRSASGQWKRTVFSTKGADMSRPVLLLDETHNQVWVFATAPERGGAIHYKKSPIDDLRFGPGRGAEFLAASAFVNNATSTKDPVNARTGIVVVASAAGNTRRYYHANVALTD